MDDVSTIGPQDSNTVTILEDLTEELNEPESPVTETVNRNSITSLNSSTELLHLIQQSTFFLNLAQQFLSQASNKTKINILSQTSTESVPVIPSLTTENTNTERITTYSSKSDTSTRTLGPANSDTVTTSFSYPTNVTTSSDDIKNTTHVIIPAIRDKTVEENLDTKSTPSFSTLVSSKFN